MNDIINEAKDLSPQIIEWRRALHRIPEVGLHLPLSCGYIKEQLVRMGVEFTGFSRSSSILVDIKGALPGPAVGIRADMDALPIKEQTYLAFASTNGNMHACGHDAHSAMMLGAVKLLLSRREELHGTVKCLFQAGEETGQGARLFIQEGGWGKPWPDAIFALHVTNSIPQLESGMIGLKDGIVMAANDSFTITIHGKGGHISDLDKLSSPIWPAGSICTGIRDLSHKWKDHKPKLLIALSCLNAGDCFNAVPDTALLKGALRSMDEDARTCVKQELKKLCCRISEESTCRVELSWESANDCLVNDAKVSAAAKETADRLFPGEVRMITEDILASEDIYHIFAKSPGSYLHLGCGFEDKREIFPLHNSHFCINEEVLWKGTAILTACAMDWTKNNGRKTNYLQ